ncbi:MAG: type II secretion system F family protein [Coriobacteriia bacterium]|nr:type II secretion system F family protein [Coriobacteriia bacterium]
MSILSVVKVLSLMSTVISLTLLSLIAIQSLQKNTLSRASLVSHEKFLHELKVEKLFEHRLTRIAFPLMLTLLTWLLSQSISLTTLIACTAFILVSKLPGYMQNLKEQKRQEQAFYELAHLIDIVALGMSAGASFDSALQMYCERNQSELAQDFKQALSSYQIGIKSREEALRGIPARYTHKSFKRFIDSVLDSLQFGSPLSPILEQQSQIIRENQQSYIEEKIEKAPVKMLIPIGTIILPAMLLMILGPLLASALLQSS